MATTKGFIKDYLGNRLLPITRGELVLDSKGQIALFSDEFVATTEHPGLMTAAEKAMLHGTSGGQNLADLYTKLGYVNTGIKVGNTTLSFYKLTTTDGTTTTTATPINIIGVENQISVAASTTTDQVISIGLNEITVTKPTVPTIVRNITVDNYGRVTAFEGSALDDADIPTILSGKTLTNCTTSADPTDNLGIATKQYVDSKFNTVNSVATGSLTFAGSLSTTDAATQALTTSNKNKYYKVSQKFTISTNYFDDTTGFTVSNNEITLKAGDTLIINDSVKFIGIPSADDVTTTISVTGGDNTANLTSALGNVTLNFSSPFVVQKAEDNSGATISLPNVSNDLDGYLSKEQFATINTSLANLLVSYTPIVSNNITGAYPIGTLTIGTAENVIYGINNISALSLENGSDSQSPAYNPILKFTENGIDTASITYQGTSGILVTKDGNSVKFIANVTIADGSKNYLEVTNGHTVGVKLGSINDGTVSDGLASLSQVATLITSSSHTFEEISYSLKGDASDSEYRYGNTLLVNAIDITI